MDVRTSKAGTQDGARTLELPHIRARDGAWAPSQCADPAPYSLPRHPPPADTSRPARCPLRWEALLTAPASGFSGAVHRPPRLDYSGPSVCPSVFLTWVSGTLQLCCSGPGPEPDPADGLGKGWQNKLNLCPGDLGDRIIGVKPEASTRPTFQMG